MKLNFAIVSRGMAALLLLAAAANAGPLPTDPSAMGAWQGSVTMNQVLMGGTLNAEVEYAVYAPGQLSGSAALGNPVDPSGGSDYVYAYEIFNDAVGGGTLTVQTLTVGVDYSNFPNAIPIPGSFVGNLPGTPELGVAPNLSRFVPSVGEPKHSVVWNYTTTLLNPGHHSDILFYASPWEPHMMVSSIGGGLASGDTKALPSPIPEPATAVLAAIAAVCLLAAKRAARRSL